MTGPASFVPEECDGYDLSVILGISPRAVRDWAARGVAMGTASHGIGTARALQVNEIAGAFAGLAMGLNAVATALLLPLVWRLVFG